MNNSRFANLKICMDKQLIIQSAKNTLAIEAESVAQLPSFIGDDFVRAVETIAGSGGRLVISGIGKSALVAQKIVATLNSTGTPALFMHAADAIHGDLGMVQADDVVMIISKSGDSPEIKVLLPLVKNFGNVVIGMVGNTNGYLANHCDILINTTVQQEACPNNLAPTSSTTAQIAMGDALAVCLMEAKGFQSGDFAKYHPGGALGKKMYLKVADLVLAADSPKVFADTPIKQVLIEITKKRLGAAAVVDSADKILGIVTDGDVRRMLEKYDNIADIKAKDIMGIAPKIINRNALAIEAFEMMKRHNINQLLVEDDGAYFGVVHIQELVREGII